MSWWQRILHRPFFIRILHWEFWSFHAVYIWVYPIWLFLCVRSRSFFFFSAANPSMENGGFLMESKMKIYGILPEEYYPKTILVNSLDSVEQIARSVRDAGFRYPLIVKPDVGGRGRGVKKISNEDELLHYLKRFPFDMLVQEFVPYEEEIGVFYFRYPGEAKGAISGIVGKQFLTVKGDGKSTIEELLRKDKRSILQIPVLTDLLGEQLQQVLPECKERLLVPYGNHARGALFLDYSHWVDEELAATIETICKRIPGFFYGRLDIRYRSIEKLKQCQEFSLIEVNGAGSEPTHMYDPRHSLLNAWKEIVKHWIILWRVSRSNNKRGIKYMSRREGIEMFRQARKYDRLLDKIVSDQ